MKTTNITMVLAATLFLFAGSAFADVNSDISKVNAYVIQPSLHKAIHDPGVSEGPALTRDQICKLAQEAKEGLASLSKTYTDKQIAAFELFDLIGEDETTAKDIRALRRELASVTAACKK